MKTDVHWTNAILSTCRWPFKNSKTASRDVDSSRAADSCRIWTLAWRKFKWWAINRLSVDTHTSSNTFEFFTTFKARSSNEIRPTFARFFNGIPLEPPRARIRATVPFGGTTSSFGQLKLTRMNSPAKWKTDIFYTSFNWFCTRNGKTSAWSTEKTIIWRENETASRRDMLKHRFRLPVDSCDQNDEFRVISFLHRYGSDGD